MIRRSFALVALLALLSPLTEGATQAAVTGSTQAAFQMPSRQLVEAPAARPSSFRAPQVQPKDVGHLGLPEKRAASAVDEHGRMRVATVRALQKSVRVPEWIAIPEGSVATLRATSDGARGLRVRLDVASLSVPLEIRVQGADGRIESRTVQPSDAAEVWTPWTEGASQAIELFVPAGAPLPDVRVTSVLHFDQSPIEKATASSCTVPASCTTGETRLDGAIEERVKSSIRIVFIENGAGFLCSATLVNTDLFPAGYLLTANHCISGTASAASLSTFWFYDPVSCADPTLAAGMIQLSGGSRLVFTNYNADSTLLLMNERPPAGAAYAGWNAARLASGDPVVSLSHPKGDTTRLATGGITREYRITDRAQDEYGVSFTRGIIEGGSSGSGLFTLSGSSLQLRGILTGTTVRNSSTGMSCTNLDEEALYGRFEIFFPQMYPYVTGSGSPPADDAPNRVLDYNGVTAEAALNGRTVTLDRRIESVGDVDVFRFTLDAPASVTLASQGSLDTVGTLMDSTGKTIVANDDGTPTDTNFGITRTLDPGTYFVMVAPWEANGTGAYRLVMSAATNVVTPLPTEANYTDLWWSAEGGWGINLAHQGSVIFATLYTYDVNGTPMWLFMSNGDKQADGSFSGTLYRATGTPFSASTWSQNSTTQVGTMRLTFTSASTATLVYSVNGVTVTKSIKRFVFALPATMCTWTTGDRTASSNYQDLWWNPLESGWGVTLAQQGTILFALLYVYDTNGQAMWLSMSNGTQTGLKSYSGTLYSSVGPPFNANPWTPATTSAVGSMSVTFTDGENGTLVYSVNGVQVVKTIRRYVFGTTKPICNPS